MSQHFTLQTDAEGVATITWDTPGKSMNVMSIEGFQQLDTLIDEALADNAVKGIVLTSGKAGSFAGGMDLNVIAKMREDGGDDPASSIFDGIMQIHTILRKIERNTMDPTTTKGGKPVAWASPGTRRPRAIPSTMASPIHSGRNRSRVDSLPTTGGWSVAAVVVIGSPRCSRAKGWSAPAATRSLGARRSGRRP